jgi:hypothetical protein
MKTKPETMADQHLAVMHALAELEERAVVVGDPQSGGHQKRMARAGLAAAALVYAARVRRLAGVR